MYDMDLTLPLQADYRLIFVSLPPPLALLVACIAVNVVQD